MKLSKEDFNYIKESESDFSHALNENYFRIVNRSMLKNYADIYKRTFKRDSKILNGCNRCILMDIRQLANVYFLDKKEMEAREKEEMEAKAKAIETTEDTQVEQPKKKARKMSEYK